MENISHKKTDRAGYDQKYASERFKKGYLRSITDRKEYLRAFERGIMTPFCQGGSYKGYAHRHAVNELNELAEMKGLAREEIVVLDAGSGRGHLSVYLAALGYRVVGIDISEEGCAQAKELADEIGVRDKCRFFATSLGSVPVPEQSIDFIIGFDALHHFIKYEDIPSEFLRIMKKESTALFVDGFGENKLYCLFHDKQLMERLGDIVLNRSMILAYFADFRVEITPTDWFTMLDKLYMVAFPRCLEKAVRKVSSLHFWLDRRIPISLRLALYLSGVAITRVMRR